MKEGFMEKVIDVDTIIRAIELAYQEGESGLQVDIPDLLALASEIKYLRKLNSWNDTLVNNLQESLRFWQNVALKNREQKRNCYTRIDKYI